MPIKEAKETEKSPRDVSEDEVDEAVAQIMEYAGVATRDSGWKWREMRDYHYAVRSIIQAMLEGELKEDGEVQQL